MGRGHPGASLGHCQPRAPFHGLVWGFGARAASVLSPLPAAPAWCGCGVARDEGTFLERLLGAPGMRLPAAQWQCQQHGGCTNCSPAFSVGPTARGAPPTITPTVCCVCDRNPLWGVTGLPQSGTRGLWVVRRGLCPGGTRGLAPGQECTAGSGPLLGPTDPGLPSTRHPVSSPSAGGDQAMDGRHYQTVLDRRSRSNRVW